MKKLFRSVVNALGYDVVPFDRRPATARRYPYANLISFLEDIKERGFDIKTMIDVGANTGSWSQRVKGVYPEVMSVLVEPQEELMPQLKAVCESAPGWKIAPVGLAGSQGKLPFLVCEDTYSSCFLTDDRASVQANRAVCEVEVMTLDDLWQQYLSPTKPELVKLDAEGLELEIVKGGSQTLENTDIVVVEAALFEFRSGKPVFADIVAEMRRHGFSLYDLVWFLRRPSDQAMGLVDCVFVSDKCPLRASNRW